MHAPLRALAVFLALPILTLAQEIVERDFAPNIVVPQRRVVPIRHTQPVVITGVSASVAIVEQVATTTLDIALSNPGHARAEAEVLVPVPDGAVIRAFDFEGKSAEPAARILPKEEARRIYERIVSASRDPALLEFVGYNVVRSAVFPVEPRGTQKIRLVFEQVLGGDGPRIDYELIRSQSLDFNIPWSVSVRIESKSPISTVYSPTHEVETRRESPNVIHVSAGRPPAPPQPGRPAPPQPPAPTSNMQPGPFRLSYLLERDGLTPTLYAYPDPKVGGGYFLLLVGMPAQSPEASENTRIRRELTLVLDTSGSMAGEKFTQAISAARQTLHGLDDGELFNVIAYCDTISPLASAPLVKSTATMTQAEAFLTALRSNGGTNIHDALTEALRPTAVENTLPLVLFLTDGLPTVGQTSEIAIRTVATKANPAARRIFPFGVGFDVNVPLLSKLAAETRGAPVFVLPNEDVEVKVGQIFRRMKGPILASPELRFASAGPPGVVPVMDVLPSTLPDVFTGDQIIVLGRYVGSSPLSCSLTGNFAGKTTTRKFDLAVDQATVRNSFVPRLWASRKIGVLIEAVQALGADRRPGESPTPQHLAKVKELTDEIVRLSTEFGILTEYTAFLAEEGSNLDQPARLHAAMDSISSGYMARSGGRGVSQGKNEGKFKQQAALTLNNMYYDADQREVITTNVQQLSDKTLYRRVGKWIESAVVGREKDTPARAIAFNTPEFDVLLTQLVTENRQSLLAVSGDVLLDVSGELVLVQLPTPTAGEQP